MMTDVVASMMLLRVREGLIGDRRSILKNKPVLIRNFLLILKGNDCIISDDVDPVNEKSAVSFMRRVYVVFASPAVSCHPLVFFLSLHQKIYCIHSCVQLVLFCATASLWDSCVFVFGRPLLAPSVNICKIASISNVAAV